MVSDLPVAGGLDHALHQQVQGRHEERSEEEHDGRTYDLTGPEALSDQDIAARLSVATGREIRYEPLSDAEWYRLMRARGLPASIVRPMLSLHLVYRAESPGPVTGWVEVPERADSAQLRGLRAGVRGAVQRSGDGLRSRERPKGPMLFASPTRKPRSKKWSRYWQGRGDWARVLLFCERVARIGDETG